MVKSGSTWQAMSTSDDCMSAFAYCVRTQATVKSGAGSLPFFTYLHVTARFARCLVQILSVALTAGRMLRSSTRQLLQQPAKRRGTSQLSLLSPACLWVVSYCLPRATCKRHTGQCVKREVSVLLTKCKLALGALVTISGHLKNKVLCRTS